MTIQRSEEDNPVAKVGDTVRIHYECRLDDGSLFVSTRERDPLELVIGNAKIIPGLQDAIVGMSSGETKEITIPPNRAYGPYHEEMTAVIDRSMIPANVELEVGVAIRVKHSDGHESDAFVTKIDGDKISVDGNHPLAGKNLLMTVELVSLTTTA